MYLKHLAISGFKSFAQKGELDFPVPITAIVGPNGSGKSNVAESFRFVLGEQSVKSMRGKRGEDLIWGGSPMLARGNRASVSLTLDNSNKIFPVEFPEIILERVVHRDGQNDYLINGSSVRLKDIQELLASANIGSTGHHIISQGEADRVLSAAPRERREMIEDALGLKVYQYKKLEAERKLQKTLENVAQVESLRREAAPHLKYLEKQMQKIEKSLELQKVLKVSYAEYLYREDTYLAYEYDRLTTARREPEQRLAVVRDSLKAAKEALRAAEAAEDASALIEAEEAVRRVTAARQAAEREYSKCEGQVLFIERRLADMERRATTPTDKAVSYEAIKALVGELEQTVDRVLQKKDQTQLERALADIIHRLKVFLDKAAGAKLPDSKADDEAEYERLKAELKNLNERVKTALADEEKVKTGYQSLKTAREAEATTGREAERAVFRLIGEERELDTALERIDRELTLIERDREEFKRELQEAVSLLGRSAADYFNYEIKSPSGEVVSREAIIGEDRGVQRERRHELEKLKIRLEELGIGATEDVMKEYNDAKARDEFLAKEVTDLQASIEKLNALISELEAKLDEQFAIGIEQISREFNRFFAIMFGGGEAKLVKVAAKTAEDEEGVDDEVVEPVTTKKVRDGIELDVKLPNKRVRGLEMLSGGERALTSIALIFAMSQVNPPPFIILDETDAALDEANSRRYGDMIEELAKKSQLILITHNRETMSRAGVLYGVTMGADGVSKLLSVKLDDAIAVAK